MRHTCPLIFSNEPVSREQLSVQLSWTSCTEIKLALYTPHILNPSSSLLPSLSSYSFSISCLCVGVRMLPLFLHVGFTFSVATVLPWTVCVLFEMKRMIMTLSLSSSPLQSQTCLWLIHLCAGDSFHLFPWGLSRLSREKKRAHHHHHLGPTWGKGGKIWKSFNIQELMSEEWQWERIREHEGEQGKCSKRRRGMH